MISWMPLPTFEISEAVDLASPWLPVLDDMRNARHLRFAAVGRWSLMPPCGPDGSLRKPPHCDLLLPDIPLGALIGKIGGSSADWAAAKGDGDDDEPEEETPEGVFAIGRHGVTSVPAGAVGPVFIGFNSRDRPVAIESLKLTIEAGY